MELLKKGPTFWLVIKIKVLKLKLKSISAAPPSTRLYIKVLMYSRCYFVMKRFNSSLLARLSNQVLVSLLRVHRRRRRLSPRSQTDAGPRLICRRSSLLSSFPTTPFFFKKSKSCDLIFPAAFIFPPFTSKSLAGHLVRCAASAG